MPMFFKGTRRALAIVGFILLSSAVLRSGEILGGGMMLQAAVDAGAATTTPPLDCPEPPARLIEAIRERDSKVAAREAALTLHEAEIEKTKAVLRTQLEKLKAAEAKLRETLTIADGAAEKDIERLTAVYEAMKSTEAAAHFAAMAPEFAAGFIARMRPEISAAVMSGMDPKEAYTIAAIIAGRNARAPKD